MNGLYFFICVKNFEMLPWAMWSGNIFGTPPKGRSTTAKCRNFSTNA